MNLLQPIKKIFDLLKIPKKPTLKTYIFLELVILYLIALTFTQIFTVWLQTILALATAVTLEITLNKLRKNIYYFPDAAIISALIISIVLPKNLPLFVAIIAPAVAILAKHFVRIRNRHIFNPANLGIVAAVYLFGTFDEWWGASSLLVLILAGTYIIGFQLRRIYLPAIFLTIYAVVGGLVQSQTIIDRLTASYSIWFFALIMLPEPQTSPVRPAGIAFFGAIASALVIISEILNLKAPLNLALFFTNLTVPVINYFTIYAKKQ